MNSEASVPVMRSETRLPHADVSTAENVSVVSPVHVIVWPTKLQANRLVATALSPYLGYAKTAEIAKASVASGRTIRELVLEQRLMDAAQLDRILSAEVMTQPGDVGEHRK